MGKPIGSLTQMGTIRLGKRTDERSPLVKDFVPLAALDDIVWGAWDVFPDDAYVAATRAGVLEGGKHIEQVADVLRDIRPMQAAFEKRYATRLEGEHIMDVRGKRAMLESIREDINRFRDENRLERVVMIWAASTEIYIEPGPAHMDIESFEKAIDAERPGDRPVDALRLRRPAGGRAVRQRRARTSPSTRRCCASSPPSATSRSAARTSRPARR